MFAIHHKPTRNHHHRDAWEIADRTAEAAAIVAVLIVAAWLGMTF